MFHFYRHFKSTPFYLNYSSSYRLYHCINWLFISRYYAVFIIIIIISSFLVAYGARSYHLIHTADSHNVNYGYPQFNRGHPQLHLLIYRLNCEYPQRELWISTTYCCYIQYIADTRNSHYEYRILHNGYPRFTLRISVITFYNYSSNCGYLHYELLISTMRTVYFNNAHKLSIFTIRIVDSQGELRPSIIRVPDIHNAIYGHPQCN
jgi:hypothetical protein